MELKEIISITGKPGLYKVVARAPKNFIVESIDGKKTRMAVNANQQVALLEEITIYTNSEDNIPLKTVFDNMVNNQPAPTAKDNPLDIKDYFKTVAPGYDEDRVYISDMKKILKWYEIVSSAPAVQADEEEAEKADGPAIES